MALGVANDEYSCCELCGASFLLLFCYFAAKSSMLLVVCSGHLILIHIALPLNVFAVQYVACFLHAGLGRTVWHRPGALLPLHATSSPQRLHWASKAAGGMGVLSVSSRATISCKKDYFFPHTLDKIYIEDWHFFTGSGSGDALGVLFTALLGSQRVAIWGLYKDTCNLS